MIGKSLLLFSQRIEAWGHGHPKWVMAVGLILRLGLSWLWLTSGWAKCQAFSDFQRSVYDYQLLPVDVATWVSYLLPGGEIALGAYLLLGWWVRYAALASVGLLVVFCMAIGWAMTQGLAINCGCMLGGGAGQAVGWPKLLENIGLILWAWGLYCWPVANTSSVHRQG